ncbi:hypothetical protein [Prochlorococcus sp. MIT 1341]|uniref:hypothetical protein n=1 Tax=Prochlorococcus sp. MIT 1341 TaxID=3096221 RepID=UPI002A7581B7|nr:hypothetical protein [Prochlorococcus sp. MIT 1341]
MSSLTIKVSAKADAMIAQLQKEIFNRRRKKVTAQGVVETLVESGAKSQSDKRYAASWKNLIKDIEKAAKQSEVHGNKPASVSPEEWALIIAHRNRKGSADKKAVKISSKKTVTKKVAKKTPPKASPIAAAKPGRARKAPSAKATA